MKEIFRLITDTPRSATLNMAADEFLMQQQKSENAVPVLRFYTWNEKAYSVGYFQNVSEVSKRLGCEKEKTPVVRRVTGGGLVCHGEDLTFSLAIKYPNRYFSPKDVKDSYLKVNMALLKGLRKAFPSLDFADCKNTGSARAVKERICFEAPTCYDLMLNGRKVVGSSQRRSAGVLLHQSAIFLSGDKNQLIKNIVEGFKSEWGVDFKENGLSFSEIEAAQGIEASRYRSEDWVFLERSFLS